MTVLSINESLFYIPFDHTGVISVCNNKYGNELACIVSDISDDRISLNIGDSVCIKRIVSEGTESVHEFVMPDFSNQKKEFMSDKGIYGMEVCTENNTICMPFIDGIELSKYIHINNLAVTFVVTINQGQVSVDAGSITAGNVLLDFYHSNLNMGDEIRVTLKNLDFVSSPLSERSFSGHTL